MNLKYVRLIAAPSYDTSLSALAQTLDKVNIKYENDRSFKDYMVIPNYNYENFLEAIQNQGWALKRINKEKNIFELSKDKYKLHSYSKDGNIFITEA